MIAVHHAREKEKLVGLGKSTLKKLNAENSSSE